ncbi:MAG: hypothetical protein V2A34_09470 [Lentisphaerota bacterium]
MFGKRNKEFVRMPGHGLSVVAPATLYAGPDHMVLIRRTGYVETYKRFYFNDIQAIIVQLTNHRLYWSLVFAVPLVMSLLWFLFSRQAQAVVAASLAAFWGLLLLINALRGPCCAFRIQTRINEEKISMISRLRAAEKARRILEKRIGGVQGLLSREAVLAQPPPPAQPEAFPVRPAKGRRPVVPRLPASLTLHRIFCGALWGEAVCSTLLALTASWVVLLFNVVLAVLSFIFGLIALARQVSVRIHPVLKFWTGLAVGFVMLQSMSMFVFLFVRLIGEVRFQTQGKAFRSLSVVLEELFKTGSAGFILLGVSAIIYLILSVLGTWAVFQKPPEMTPLRRPLPPEKA